MSRLSSLQKKSSSQRPVLFARRQAKAAGPVVAEVRDNALRYAGSTRDWAAPKVDSAVEWVGPRVESAAEWASPHVSTAREWVGPRIEPTVDKVKSDVLPAVTGAVATALAASEPARHEALSRGSAALAALKGEIAPPKKTHKVRSLVLMKLEGCTTR